MMRSGVGGRLPYRVALAVGLAVNACWNWVSAVGGSHVPASVEAEHPQHRSITTGEQRVRTLK